MALQIIGSTDEIKVETIILLIYGQPDAGKTSTAFTAKNTLLIDCDRGAHRSRYRQSCIQPKSWGDVMNLAKQPELDKFDTIAVDTVGRLLEMITSSVLSDGSSHGSNGILNLRGYGELKQRFVAWLNSLRELNKDIVLLAHHKNQTQQEKVGSRYETKHFLGPDIIGGAQQEVMKVCDAVGFLHREGHQRVMNFDATSERAGKNAARIQYHAVPDFESSPTYLAGIIQLIKDNLSGIGREERDIQKDVEEFKAKLLGDVAVYVEQERTYPLESLNLMLAEANCIERVAVKSICLKEVGQIARNYGYSWDKENQVFKIKEEEPADVPGNEAVQDDDVPSTDESTTDAA